MRIAIYHGSFATEAGGGEVAALRAAKALIEAGHEVDLYTSLVDKKVMQLIYENANIYLPPKIIDISTTNSFMKIFKILSNKHMLSSLWAINEYKNAAKDILSKINGLSKEYDILIAKQSPALISAIDILPGDITYFHYPSTLIGLIPLDKYIPDSAMPFVILYKKFIISMEHKILMNVICNNEVNIYKIAAGNTWTKNGLLKINLPILKILPDICRHKFIRPLTSVSVVYEPIEYETYSSRYDPNTKKRLVLTVSRYTPGKNLWSIIYVASRIPEAHFVIAGTTRAHSSAKVVAQLESLIDKLRAKNVTLEKDVPKKRLIDLYSEAMIYLHPLYTEHFGIAIAEGAAAGAVPVVYKDGGGWLDIASKIDPMLGYTTINEAVTIVRRLLSSKELWLSLSKKSVKVASEFSWENYKKRLNAVVNEAYEIKRRSTHHS